MTTFQINYGRQQDTVICKDKYQFVTRPWWQGDADQWGAQKEGIKQVCEGSGYIAVPQMYTFSMVKTEKSGGGLLAWCHWK